MTSAKTYLKNKQDFVAGLIFIGFGIFGIFFGKGYAVGTITRMGPGYLPVILSYILIMIGAFISIKAIRFGESTIEPFHLRPMIFVLGAVFVYSILIVRMGFVVSVSFVAVLSSLAMREIRWLEVVTMAFVMALLTTLVFIHLLGLPISVWPRW